MSKIEEVFEKHCYRDLKDRHGLSVMNVDQFKSALAEMMPSDEEIENYSKGLPQEFTEQYQAVYRLGMKKLRSTLGSDKNG